jgi:class 3 adenylate cyclase/tetratricopeptide (TPR) repeat protein
VVTILFCDLVGFTARSEQADPEDVRTVLRRYHARLKQDIEAFGGTVEKFIGDAVMAVFGAPVVHEDDPERAVRAGLRILESIASLNAAHPGMDLSVRIGVNSGETLVSPVAKPELGQGMVAGDVVNTAARLQAAAPVDSVVVGERTQRATASVFDYEHLEPTAAKGKATPLDLWRALAPRANTPPGWPRIHPTPFVGREVELSDLTAAFDRAVGHPSAQLALVVGEPGAGKSRLVEELASRLEGLGVAVTWRQGRCLPYGEGITFWAMGEIVKGHAGILESDSSEVAQAKLDSALREGPDRDWIRERLLPLIGVEAASAAERDELFTAWRRFLESTARVRPAVFVFEDLHWADDAMLTFLEHVVERSEAVPMLLLGTARPELFEQRPAWANGDGSATTIQLAPLADQAAGELITALLDQAVLPADVQSPILEAAGGNPLYVEEFIRFLQDRRVLVRNGMTLSLAEGAEIPAPESLQALIAARLDTLPPEHKQLLWDASVIGRVFWTGAVATMSGREGAEVADVNRALSRKEFVRSVPTSSMKGDTEYSFWHILVRDVAYSQIPRAQRGEKHRRAASWIESVAGGRVEDYAEILAHHYGQALDLLRASGDAEKAQQLEEPTLRYLVMAGDQAVQLDAAKAHSHYGAALSRGRPGHPERGSLLVKCAHAAELVGRYGEAKGLLDEAIAEFEAQGSIANAAGAGVRLSGVLRQLGRQDEGEEPLREALRTLESLGPGPQLAKALEAMGRRYLFFSHQPEEGLRWLRKALDMCRELGLPSDEARVLQFVGASRCALGDLGGLDDMQEALRMCLDLGLDSFVTATSYNNLADLLCRLEDPVRAVQIWEQGIEFVERRGMLGFPAFMKGSVAWVRTELGQWDEALETLDDVLRWEGSKESPHLLVGALSSKARIAVMRGKLSEARSLEEQFLPLARQINEADYLAIALVGAALIEQAEGRTSGAVALIEEYAETTRFSPLSRRLPSFTDALRILVIAGDLGLAESLLEEEAQAAGRRAANSILTGKAILAEARGELVEAGAFFLQAAEGWQAFGHVPERSQALLGAGRSCLGVSLWSEAQETLRQARNLFVGLGAEPALAETDELLERARVRSSNRSSRAERSS